MAFSIHNAVRYATHRKTLLIAVMALCGSHCAAQYGAIAAGIAVFNAASPHPEQLISFYRVVEPEQAERLQRLQGNGLMLAVRDKNTGRPGKLVFLLERRLIFRMPEGAEPLYSDLRYGLIFSAKGQFVIRNGGDGKYFLLPGIRQPVRIHGDDQGLLIAACEEPSACTAWRVTGQGAPVHAEARLPAAVVAVDSTATGTEETRRKASAVLKTGERLLSSGSAGKCFWALVESDWGSGKVRREFRLYESRGNKPFLKTKIHRSLPDNDLVATYLPAQDGAEASVVVISQPGQLLWWLPMNWAGTGATQPQMRLAYGDPSQQFGVLTVDPDRASSPLENPNQGSTPPSVP